MSAEFMVTPRIERQRTLTAVPRIWWQVVSAMVGVCLSAQLQAQSAATTQLLHRAFVDKDFAAKSYGPVRWLKGGKAYATVEPSGTEGATDIVAYDIETGQRDILVSGQVASGENKPDLHRRLLFLRRPESSLDLHQFEESLAAKHARRLLGVRQKFRER